MKILLVSLNYFPELTGVGKYNTETTEWLCEQGHQVRVITAPPYYPQWRVSAGYSAGRYCKEQIGRVEVFRCPLYVPERPSGLRRLVHMISFALSSAPVILAQALFWHPDVIVMTEPPIAVAPAVLLASRLCGARSHLHVQDFEVDAAFELGILKSSSFRRVLTWCERTMTGMFTTTSTISARMMDRLLKKGASPERAGMVPNWADLDGQRQADGSVDWRAALGIGARLFVLYAGAIGRKQGLETVIEAARNLRHRPEIRFVICGEGAARSEMEALAEGLPNVVFLPVQSTDRFHALLAAADVHVLPQRAKAADLVMPSKLGNMLGSGRPVIAAAAPGTLIYEAAEGCGLIVEPENISALVGAIEQLWANPEVRHAMGQRARQRAREEWSRETILPRLEALLQSGATVPVMADAASPVAVD